MLQWYRMMHAHQRRMLGELVGSRLEYSPAMDLEEFATWLASRMPNLETLSLFVSACPPLPALSQLQHIEIQAGHTFPFPHLAWCNNPKDWQSMKLIASTFACQLVCQHCMHHSTAHLWAHHG